MNTETGQNTVPGKTRGRGLFPMLAIGAFLVVVFASSVRVVLHMNEPGDLNPQRWALVDFRDAVYYPVVSFLGG